VRRQLPEYHSAEMPGKVEDAVERNFSELTSQNT
jgi:hypothetical protein